MTNGQNNAQNGRITFEMVKKTCKMVKIKRKEDEGVEEGRRKTARRRTTLA